MLIAGGIMTSIRHTDFLTADGKPTKASIISLYASPSSQKWHPRELTVVARSPAGLVGKRRIPRDRVRGCQVGDQIPAMVVGKRLRLDPWPCADRSWEHAGFRPIAHAAGAATLPA
jgi:hypothetical protein